MAPLCNIVSGTVEQLQQLYFRRAAVNRGLDWFGTNIDGTTKDIFADHFRDYILDHFEFQIGGAQSNWRTETPTGAGTAAHGDSIWTQKASDYSGKVNCSISGTQVTLTGVNGYQVAFGIKVFAVLKDGSRIKADTLPGFQTSYTIGPAIGNISMRIKSKKG